MTSCRMDGRWIIENQNNELDYNFLSRITGRKVTVTMTYGVYQGVLIHVDRGHSVMLCKVKDLANNVEKAGTHMFFSPDILDVALQMDHDSCCTKVFGESPKKQREIDPLSGVIEKTEDIESRETNCHSVSIKAIESAVYTLDVQFTVIDQLRTLFDLSISHIKCQTIIGVAPAGSNLSRHGNLCWLQVIHDCRGLSDCLYHQYGTVLSNVFDTQVADVFLFHMNTGGFLPQHTCTLDECLSKHLNMQLSEISFLSQTQDIMKDNRLVWSLHPMPLPLQKALALEAAYVLSLYMTMVNAMMADFTSLVNGNLKVYAQNNESVSSWIQFPNKLPQEFRQLSVLHTKRKEQALKHYVLDDNGLLMRPGNTQKIFGENWRQSDLKPQFPDHLHVVGKHILPASDSKTGKRDLSSRGIQQYTAVISDEPKLEFQDAVYGNISETSNVHQILPKYPVCIGLESGRENLSGLQLVPPPPKQTRSPLFTPVSLVGSRVRMSAAQILAKTNYTASI
ncbi:piRNA biogenesis protein EXD1-like isoform X3 [Mixophyes fleayi]|uniref:piRNA biogenesis protein EXD1-like isoform X3 n=1 Tax=Mixophyes fleayi TaxID=3061075 RepID=UPI003F4DCFCC